jgi:geranylgeranyl diphosphate synthase, type I
LLNTLFARYLPKLDQYMRHIVTEQHEYPHDFSVMLQYAMGWVEADGIAYDKPTGKRIRPVLLLLCTEAANGNWQTALPCAAAVELLHNFSLIHDDVQDDSPLRHNRPTVWKLWGIANAINAGDALFSLSFRSLETLTHHTELLPETILKVWHIYNRTTLELTRGQHLDMRFEKQSLVTSDEYISMISGKSAALISACAEMGALIGSHDSKRASAFAEFGLNLGIAFQIHDDILGIWGDPKQTGKSVATDIVSRKKSLPVLYGLSQSAALVDIYNRPSSMTDEMVLRAVELLDQADARAYARTTEDEYYEKAIAALNRAEPETTALAGLNGIVDTLFDRQY